MKNINIIVIAILMKAKYFMVLFIKLFMNLKEIIFMEIYFTTFLNKKKKINLIILKIQINIIINIIKNNIKYNKK